MKKYISVILLLTVLITACKTQHKCCSKNSITNPAGEYTGTVSHKYAEGGCAVVIIIPASGDQEERVIIPSQPLAKEFDKDGKKIHFNFRLLRMPNPPGCTIGNVAEISDISD
jgi:hypothetical protein